MPEWSRARRSIEEMGGATKRERSYEQNQEGNWKTAVALYAQPLTTPGAHKTVQNVLADAWRNNMSLNAHKSLRFLGDLAEFIRPVP